VRQSERNDGSNDEYDDWINARDPAVAGFMALAKQRTNAKN